MNRGFRATPKPDNDVVALLERALNAAKRGDVRAVTLVLINPVNEVETACAGELGSVRRSAIIGGLSQAAHKLLNDD